jgi:hypothetical protein
LASTIFVGADDSSRRFGATAQAGLPEMSPACSKSIGV